MFRADLFQVLLGLAEGLTCLGGFLWPCLAWALRFLWPCLAWALRFLWACLAWALRFLWACLAGAEGFTSLGFGCV